MRKKSPRKRRDFVISKTFQMLFETVCEKCVAAGAWSAGLGCAAAVCHIAGLAAITTASMCVHNHHPPLAATMP